MKVQTHLMFDTTSPEAMKFYQDELGATVVLEMPRWYDDDDDQTVRASSTTPTGYLRVRGNAAKGAACSISISTQTPEEADRLFSALAADGKFIPGNNAASHHARLVDKFGTDWALIP